MATTVTAAGVKKATAFWLKFLKDLNVGENNIALYKETFDGMNLDEFQILVDRIKTGKFLMPVFVKNMDNKVKGTFERVIQVCEKYNIPLFERLVLTDPVTGLEFLTPEESLILYMPSRRQIHHLLKKISLPEHDKIIDHMTGAVTGDSKGASMTQPEFNALDGKGYQASLVELAKIRGGDPEAFKVLTDMLENNGSASISPILDMGTETVSVKNFNRLLLGMHLDNNA